MRCGRCRDRPSAAASARTAVGARAAAPGGVRQGRVARAEQPLAVYQTVVAGRRVEGRRCKGASGDPRVAVRFACCCVGVGLPLGGAILFDSASWFLCTGAEACVGERRPASCGPGRPRRKTEMPALTTARRRTGASRRFTRRRRLRRAGRGCGRRWRGREAGGVKTALGELVTLLESRAYWAGAAPLVDLRGSIAWLPKGTMRDPAVFGFDGREGSEGHAHAIINLLYCMGVSNLTRFDGSN